MLGDIPGYCYELAVPLALDAGAHGHEPAAISVSRWMQPTLTPLAFITGRYVTRPGVAIETAVDHTVSASLGVAESESALLSKAWI
jgi:hypothetical protein